MTCKSQTIAQYEIPFMNFESEVPETVAQHKCLNFIVIQINGESQFNYIEHAIALALNEVED